MDTVTLWQQGKELIHKYRHLLLILLVGLLFMSLPEKEIPTAPVQENSVPQEKTLQEELEQILSKIKGAGKVQVLLTEFRGTETVFQEDTDRADTSDRSDTVILTGSDREEEGLIRQINPPVYLGALIVCQGGDDPSVKLAIVEAVMRLTGLRSTEISVLKMK